MSELRKNMNAFRNPRCFCFVQCPQRAMGMRELVRLVQGPFRYFNQKVGRKRRELINTHQFRLVPPNAKLQNLSVSNTPMFIIRPTAQGSGSNPAQFDKCASLSGGWVYRMGIQRIIKSSGSN